MDGEAAREGERADQVAVGDLQLNRLLPNCARVEWYELKKWQTMRIFRVKTLG